MNIDILRQYAFSFVGTRYSWGAKGVVNGLDCSGLVSELLKAAGVMANKEELNSQGIFDRFQTNGTWDVYKAGSLVFYGKDVKHITHVGMMIDQESVIQAAGGDETTDTPDEAAQQRAFVKIRHIGYRADKVAVIRPKYPWEWASK